MLAREQALLGFPLSGVFNESEKIKSSAVKKTRLNKNTNKQNTEFSQSTAHNKLFTLSAANDNADTVQT